MVGVVGDEGIDVDPLDDAELSSHLAHLLQSHDVILRPPEPLMVAARRGHGRVEVAMASECSNPTLAYNCGNFGPCLDLVDLTRTHG